MTSTRQQRLIRFRALRCRPQVDGTTFESLVAAAFDSLPVDFRERVHNVALVVEERPAATLLRKMGLRPGDTLLGLYQGIPLLARGGAYSLVPPDRITLFREPILSRCRTEAEVVREVRATLLHELGHYFGLDDAELR